MSGEKVPSGLPVKISSFSLLLFNFACQRMHSVMRFPSQLALLTFLPLFVLVASQPGVEAEIALVEALVTANTSSTLILAAASAVAVSNAVSNDLAAASPAMTLSLKHD